MLKQFEHFLYNELKVRRDQNILLAVSGGMDSMCMWHLFRETNIKYGIAHCNFKLRGKESDGDAQFVKDSCNENEQLFSTSFDTKSYADEKKISIQMAARELRYHYFEKIKKEHHFDLVALAHHLDDQIETFFIQLIRKAGIGALGGMPVVNEKLVRPMMFTYRSKIESFVKKRNIQFHEDKSNASDAYLRNKIRHHLIPSLKSENPDFSEDVLKMMNEFESVDAKVNDYFEIINKTLEIRRDKEIAYQIDDLLALPNSELFFEKLLRNHGFNASDIHDVWKSMKGQSGKIFYAPGYTLLKDRNELVIVEKGSEDEDIYEMKKDELLLFTEIPFEIRIIDTKRGYNLEKNENYGQFDYDKLKQGIIFRKWKKADYFFPIGLSGKKKLSNFFVDEKYNLLQKGRQWLMITGGDICWIVGKRIDDRFKVDGKTKKIIELIYRG